MDYQKPNRLCYWLAQAVSWFVARSIFKREFIRNEIKGKKGPFVVIANHEAAYDFVNLIGATARPMSFVISKSFFSTLPIQGFLKRMGVIPKQQFQTTVNDLKRMKRVIEHGQPLVIYPAGLMCEDGLSTPIPGATYKFIKWMDADVYVARTRGTYFVMPKWSKGFRPGKTTMDIYKLFDKEELKGLSLEQVQQRADAALLYDAYREQEDLRVKYKNNRDIRGLENVLYMCPHCGGEFTIRSAAEDTLRCESCGFTAVSDDLGFLETQPKAYRYVSDWSRYIYNVQREKLLSGEETVLSARTIIRMVDEKKHKFVDAGSGTLELQKGQFLLTGTIAGEAVRLTIPANVPTLPFSPGKYLELQDGGTIYRCVLEDGRLVMKFINMLKICYELSKKEKASVCELHPIC